MKKVLVVLLALAVAGGVFAADLGNGLTAVGELKTGFGIWSNDDGNDDTDDTKIGMWNNDAGDNFRARLTFAWSGDAGGTKVRFQAGNDQFTTGTRPDVMIKYAYGWANLFEKKVVVYGGKIGDDLWGLGKISNVADPSFDAGDVYGARLEFKPIDGLSVGAFLPIPITKAAAQPVGDVFKSLVFGGVYSASAFKAEASLKLIPGAPKTDTTAEGDSTVDFIAGVEIPLGALNVALNLRTLSGDTGYFWIGPKVTFKADALSVYGKFNVSIDSDDKVKTSGDWRGGAVEAEGDIGFNFEAEARYALNSTTGIYGRLGSDNVAYLAGNGLWIRPGVTFAIGPNTNIEIFDTLSGLGKDDPAKGKAFANQLQVELVWTF